MLFITLILFDFYFIAINADYILELIFNF